MSTNEILYPLGDGVGMVRLVQASGSDLMCVSAARVSYDHDGGWKANDELSEKDKKLIKYLLKEGHWSPFEHCHATVHLKIPLFLRSQFVRHRSFSFSEVSARYTEVRDEFYLPNEFRQQAKSNRQASDLAEQAPEWHRNAHNAIYDSVDLAINAYEYLLKTGVAREQARMVLPQAMYTSFFMSGSLRSWLHFLAARVDPAAQYESQQVASAMLKLVRQAYPETFAAWEELK